MKMEPSKLIIKCIIHRSHLETLDEFISLVFPSPITVDESRNCDRKYMKITRNPINDENTMEAAKHAQQWNQMEMEIF